MNILNRIRYYFLSESQKKIVKLAMLPTTAMESRNRYTNPARTWIVELTVYDDNEKETNISVTRDELTVYTRDVSHGVEGSYDNLFAILLDIHESRRAEFKYKRNKVAQNKIDATLNILLHK